MVAPVRAGAGPAPALVFVIPANAGIQAAGIAARPRTIDRSEGVQLIAPIKITAMCRGGGVACAQAVMGEQ